MPEPIVIEAGPKDLGTIASIARHTWPVAYGAILSPEQLNYMLDLFYSESALLQQTSLGQRFLLLMANDLPVGFAGYETHYKGTRSTRLHKLYVLPEQQGTGSGRTLLNAVIARARIDGDTRVELNVNRYNKAISWYERQGFHAVRSEVIEIGQGYVMDDHVMELAL